MAWDPTISFQASLSAFDAVIPGLTGTTADAAVGARAALAVRGALRLAGLRRAVEVLDQDAPMPGMPTVRVTLPEEWADTRAPRVPADIPTPPLETLMRTPGATLNDLLIRNPNVQTPGVVLVMVRSRRRRCRHRGRSRRDR